MPPPNVLGHLNRMERWMLDDLAVANGVVLDGTGRQCRANSGTLLLICCYIDALGAFLAGRARESFGRRHGVSVRQEFVAFVNAYMDGFRAASRTRAGAELRRSVMTDRCAPGCGKPSYPPPAREKLTYTEILYVVFRNGLAHEFLPRGWAGFVRGNQPYLRWDRRLRGLVVNLDRLLPDFIQALQHYCEDVRQTPTVRAEFRRRLRFIHRH